MSSRARLDQPALDAVWVALIVATSIADGWGVVGVTASFGGSDCIAIFLLLALPLASLSIGAVGT